MKKLPSMTLAVAVGAVAMGAGASPASADVVYKNCTEVKLKHGAPIPFGGYGYRAGLDRDHDGVACEMSFPAGTAASTNPISQGKPSAAQHAAQYAAKQHASSARPLVSQQNAQPAPKPTPKPTPQPTTKQGAASTHATVPAPSNAPAPAQAPAKGGPQVQTDYVAPTSHAPLALVGLLSCGILAGAAAARRLKAN